MPFTLPPITLTENQTSLVNIPGNLGSVTYLKMVNASPYLLAITNLLGGSDYMQPGEANVWPVPGLSTSVQVTPQQFGISPAIIPSTVLVVTWYLEGEQPNGNYPVNFNTLSFLGSSVTTNASTPNSVNQDEWTPFVLTGLVATKDGSIANKLDVTEGVAWLRQADQSLGRVAENATSFTTIQISSIYYLDLNPDGTYSFAISHSGQPNYLPIAQVTTDASGNILAVTDKRTLNTQLLGAMAPDDAAVIQMQTLGLLANSLGAGVDVEIGYFSPGHALFFNLPQVGATAIGTYFHTWDGANGQVPLSIGGPFAGAHMVISQTGSISTIADQATVGSFGVPVIVAQAIDVHVTVTTLQTILSYTPSVTGLFRVSLHIEMGNTGAAQNITALVQYTEEHGSGTPLSYFATGDTVSHALVLFDGSHAVGPGGGQATMPQTIYALAGHAIIVDYLDPGGTPSDYISAIIERLA